MGGITWEQKNHQGHFLQKTYSRGSGERKLAAHRESSTPTRDTSHAETTTSEYREEIATQPEEVSAAKRLITSTSERTKGIDRTKAAVAEIEAARQPTPVESVTSIPQSGAMYGGQYYSPSQLEQLKKTEAYKATAIEESELLEGLKKEQAIDSEYYYSPTTHRYEPTLTTSIKGALYDYKESIDEALEKSTATGYNVPEKEAISNFSTYIYEKSQNIAEGIREREAYSARFAPARELSPLISESAARTVEMAGMILGGIETIFSSKETAKAALVTGALSVPVGITQSIKDEPKQFISDIAFQAAIGAGLAKGGGVIAESIKPTLPKITPKSTIGEPVIKLSIPEAEVTPLKPSTLTQVEYVRAVGADLFKISETPIPTESPISTGTSLSTIIKEGAPSTISEIYTPSPKQTIPVLVGETKSGFTDVYIKVDQPTIRSIGEQYFGKVETIVTPEGKLVSFEPTGLREMQNVVYPKKYTPLPETPEFKLIGKSDGIKSKLPEFPFETAKKVDVYKSELEFTEILKTEKESILTEGKPLTEQIAIESKKEYNLLDVYREPSRPTIQIGKRYDVSKQHAELMRFFEATEAEVSPTILARRRAARQQQIFKKQKTEEELIAEFEKDQAAFIEEEKLLSEFEKQQELFMQEKQQIFKQKPVFKEKQTTSEIAEFLRSDVESILSRQEPKFKTTPETVTKVRLKQKPVTLQKPKTTV